MQTLILKRSIAFVAVLFMATLLLQVLVAQPAYGLQNNADWDGEGTTNNFSEDANWVGDVAPSGGESLYLKTQFLTGDTFNNDLTADTSFESIVLVGTGTESSYTLTGNSVILTSAEDADKGNQGGLINATNEYEYKTFVVELDITLAANMDFYAGAKLIVGKSDGTNTLDLGSFTMTKTGEYPLKIYSAVSATTGEVTISNGEYVALEDSTVALTIGNGGTLKGTATVGDVTVQSGGEVAPGMSPGCLTTGDLTFVSGSTFTVELEGATITCPTTEYDQTIVTGAVDLGGATLAIARLASYEPADGTEFMIISNDLVDPVSGTFAGLAEGATTTVDGAEYTVSYVGGDGNDVVLSATMVAVPTAPDTGFSAYVSNYIFVALATIALAGGITFVARKFQKVNA